MTEEWTLAVTEIGHPSTKYAYVGEDFTKDLPIDDSAAFYELMSQSVATLIADKAAPASAL